VTNHYLTKTSKMANIKKKKTIYSYGWLPDLPDHRDLLYSAPMLVMRKLPVKTDLRKNCSAVYDQGALGSCTANALGAAFQFGQKKQAIPILYRRVFLFITTKGF
jgi:hypothetical protein